VGSDAGSGKPAIINDQTAADTTLPGTGPKRHTLKPRPSVSASSASMASKPPHPTAFSPSPGSLTIAPTPKPAATPAAAATAVDSTRSAVAPLVSRASVTPAALTPTSTTSQNLLTGLLGLVGLDPSAAPGAPTPLDNPLGWVMAAVTRRFGQPVSNVAQTLAAPAATTSLVTAAPVSASSDVIATIPVSHPGPVVLSPDGATAYTTSNRDGTVVVIDTATNKVITTIKIQRTGHGPALHNASLAVSGTRLYVVKNGGQVAVIDTATNKVITDINAGATSVVIRPGIGLLYVARGFSEDGLTIYDTNTYQIVHTVRTGNTGFEFLRDSISITPDGTRVYITSERNIEVIDSKTEFRLLTVIHGEGFTSGVAFSPNSTRAYVGVVEHSHGIDPAPNKHFVDVIDTATNKVIAHIDVGRGQTVGAIAVSPDGTRVYAAVGGNVSAIDTATNKIIGTLAGVHTNSMVISADGTRLYLTGNNSVTVISTAAVTPIV
jgi:YVTN family beta-propeller protein